jgi:hypothetical protein
MFNDDDFKLSFYNGEATLSQLGKEVERDATREFGFDAGGFRTSKSFAAIRSGRLQIKVHKAIVERGARADDQVVDWVFYEPGDGISLELKGGSMMMTLIFANYRKIHLDYSIGPYDVTYCGNPNEAKGWVPAFAVLRGPVVSFERVIKEWHSNLSGMQVKEETYGALPEDQKDAHFRSSSKKSKKLTPKDDNQIIILECDNTYQARCKFNNDLQPVSNVFYCLVSGKPSLIERLKSAFRSGKYWVYFEHLDAWATLSERVELERACENLTEKSIGYVSGVISKDGHPDITLSFDPSSDEEDLSSDSSDDDSSGDEEDRNEEDHIEVKRQKIVNK